jgi:hypothetical protein
MPSRGWAHLPHAAARLIRAAAHARPGAACHAEEWHGVAPHVMAGPGAAGSGAARHGAARHG